MPSFPTLATGSVAKYPLTRGNSYRGMVYFHADLSEQRFSRGQGGLATFELVFTNVSTADKNTVRQFFIDRFGSFDHSWDLTLPDPSVGSPTTWNNLQFIPGQQFEANNISPDRWQFSLKVRQVRIH